MEAKKIISLYFDGHEIRQRQTDGYINATNMCTAFNKEFFNYKQNKTTKEYLSALESDLGIPRSKLIEIKKGGISQNQGTWVHPQVATHLATWLSPKLAVQVSKWVLRYLSGDITLVQDIVKQHEQVTGNKVMNIDFDYEERSARLQAIKAETAEKLARAENNRIQTLEKVKTIDAHLYTALKSDFINSIMSTNLISNEDKEKNILYNKDLSTLVKEELGTILPNNQLSSLGRAIKKEYVKKYGSAPPTAEKNVAGAIRKVCVYAS